MADTAKQVEATDATTGKKESKWEPWQFSLSVAGVVVSGAGMMVAYRQSEEARRQSEEAHRQSEEAHRQSEEAYRQSEEYKIAKATERMLQPYVPEIPGCLESVQRKAMETFKQRVKTWAGHATILSGLYESGKSTIVQRVLDGQRGVVRITVEDSSWKEKLYAKMGVKDVGMFEVVLTRVREKLGKDAMSKVPVIVLDIPRDSDVKISTVSTFAKDFSSDTHLAHVVVCASSATFAHGFDAGGERRRVDIWVGDMEDDEAKAMLQKAGVSDGNAERIIKDVGKNPGRIEGAAEKLKEGVSIERVVAANAELAATQVEKMLAIKLDDHDSKRWPVGVEIVKALLESKNGEVGDSNWTKRKIQVKDVAREIKGSEAHAIHFHATDKVWRFSSPAHRKAAEAQVGKWISLFGF